MCDNLRETRTGRTTRMYIDVSTPRQRLAPVTEGVLFGLLAALIWGAYFALARAGVVAGLLPDDIAFLRYGIAGALLSVWFLLPRLGWTGSDRTGHGRSGRGRMAGMTWARVCILTVIGGPAFTMISVSAYRFAPLAHGALFQPGTMTTASAILGYVLLREPIGPARIIGTLVIVAGLAITAGETLLRVSPWTLVGDAMFACAGFQWALYATLTRHWRIAPMTATACMTVLSGVIFTPFYLLGDGLSRLLALPPAMLATQVVAQGVLSGIVAVFAYSAAVERIGSGRAGVFGALVPAIGILLGIPLVGDLPTELQVIGLVVVSLGTVLSGGFLRRAR
jgi:drug/metabolite transporter (DMT)-like permease